MAKAAEQRQAESAIPLGVFPETAPLAGATVPTPPDTAPEPRRGISQAATLTIACLGLVSAWLYWHWLVRPYWLPRYVEQPLLDLGKIGGYDPGAGRRYALPLIALWVVYLAAWALAKQVRGERPLHILAFAGGLGLSLLLLWLYPITAADIFNYLIYGLVQHQGQNPLVVEPRDVIGLPLIGFSAWPFYPSPYGPLWQSIAWAITAVTGERLLAGIIGFKLVFVACHLLNTLLVARIAAGTGVMRPGVAALVYAWNPLLLYETAGNGHNDILMLTGLLLGLWCLLAERRSFLALPAVTLAALAKYVAALWLPIFLYAWLPHTLRARRWRAILLSGLLALLLLLVCFGPYWAEGRALDGVRRQSDLYTTSLASWVIALLTENRLVIGRGLLLDIIKRASVVLILFVMVLARPRPGDPRSLTHAIFDVSLAYLLVGALWFQPWYLVPLVGLLPLVSPVRRLIAISYALGATGSYVFYFFVWPALAWTPDRFIVQSWAAGIAHGPTWLALIAAACWWLWCRLGTAARHQLSVDGKCSR